MATHNDTGNWGENVAREYLVGKGYAIVDTNVRMGHNELDIVAMYRDRIVFVEVKTRTGRDFDPIDSIDRKKIMHLSRAADAYVRAYDIPHEVQFDVILVTGTPGSEPEITHYPDAITPPLGSYR